MMLRESEINSELLLYLNQTEHRNVEYYCNKHNTHNKEQIIIAP